MSQRGALKTWMGLKVGNPLPGVMLPVMFSQGVGPVAVVKLPRRRIV